MKNALIIGISGQDGAYLADLLLKEGYNVFGGKRPSASGDLWRLKKLGIEVEILDCDVLDPGSIERCVDIAQPQEVYNLAAQGHDGISWLLPRYTIDVNAMGAMNIFQAVGRYGKIFQASTGAMYAGSPCPIEGYGLDTIIRPLTPYSIGKTTAHYMAKAFRQRGHHISCGIMFNHESPLRPEGFVTQKIAKAARGKRIVHLGNLDAERDWGHARDYVEGMWRLLQHDDPMDLIFATGIKHSVMDFCKAAYGEKWGDWVVVDEKFYRPADPPVWGNAKKTKEILGWEPKTTFEDLVKEMVG